MLHDPKNVESYKLHRQSFLYNLPQRTCVYNVSALQLIENDHIFIDKYFFYKNNDVFSQIWPKYIFLGVMLCLWTKIRNYVFQWTHLSKEPKKATFLLCRLLNLSPAINEIVSTTKWYLIHIMSLKDVTWSENICFPSWKCIGIFYS